MIWDNITFMIDFDLLDNDLKMTIILLLYLDNKDTMKIQVKVMSTQVANIVK